MSDEDQTGGEDAVADEWAAALEEQGDEEAKAAEAASEAADSSDAVQFQQFDGNTNASGSGDIQLDAILDVPVIMAMEIGRTRINIRNLLQLNQGSVVELDRLAGEPMDVLVNGTLIAQGEVVVVNEKFGIRLTDIVSPADRINQLKG